MALYSYSTKQLQGSNKSNMEANSWHFKYLTFFTLKPSLVVILQMETPDRSRQDNGCFIPSSSAVPA